MRAVYARVSTQQQAQAQTIEQQLERLQGYSQEQGWAWPEEAIFLDEGYSGASLKRPGLDRLRDQVAQANFDLVLMTAPDRLARKYVHQVLLIEEIEKGGCQVEFADRPMSQDPHDHLLLQIRGVVAEYERNLITERMRRGRLQKYRAGTLLPWSTPPLVMGWIRPIPVTRQESGWPTPPPRSSPRCSLIIRRQGTPCAVWPNTSPSWACPTHGVARTGMTAPSVAS